MGAIGEVGGGAIINGTTVTAAPKITGGFQIKSRIGERVINPKVAWGGKVRVENNKFIFTAEALRSDQKVSSPACSTNQLVPQAQIESISKITDFACDVQIKLSKNESF